MRFIVNFVNFWYDFIVGDDWTVAVAVIVGLAIAAVLAPTSVPLWWWMPLVVAGILTYSLSRATRASR